MKLSTRSRYGARILLDLARHHHQEPISTGEISKRQDISLKYIEQLIRRLKKAGFITSARGPKGGYVLAKPPQEITLGQVVRLFESQSDLVKCITNPEQCWMSDDCRVRVAWKRASAAFYDSLDATTIGDLLQEADQTKEENTAAQPHSDPRRS